MAKKVDKDGFSLLPKSVGPGDCWFYEGRKGLTIAYTAEGTLQSIVGIVEIPWSKLDLTIRRYQTYKRKKNAAKVRRAAK